ncbi:MAG: hypothetical protein ACI4LE_05970, partial [Faecalibacterium sp.]
MAHGNFPSQIQFARRTAAFPSDRSPTGVFDKIMAHLRRLVKGKSAKKSGVRGFCSFFEKKEPKKLFSR